MIDIGANLAHDSFDADREALLARAVAAGLEAIVITGSSGESAQRAFGMARAQREQRLSPSFQAPALYSTAGLHPHHAQDWSPELAAQFRALATEPEVVALGECGLDYCRDFAPRDAQRHSFAAQLALAVDCGKPLFLHQREAHADFHAILREHRAQLSGCVVHCFTDTAAALDDYLALDCHIGITGWVCDERRGAHLLPLMARIPAARLLIETDAPYLLPRNVKPAPKHRRNEPAFLPWVARAIADARGESEAELAAQTSLNARQFFRLPQNEHAAS